MTLDGKPDWMQYASIPRKMQEQGHSTYSYGWVNNVEPLTSVPKIWQEFQRHKFENGFVVEDLQKFFDDVEDTIKKENPNWQRYGHDGKIISAKIVRIKAARIIGTVGMKTIKDVEGKDVEVINNLGLREIKEFVEKYWPNQGCDGMKE